MVSWCMYSERYVQVRKCQDGLVVNSSSGLSRTQWNVQHFKGHSGIRDTSLMRTLPFTLAS